jgi:hypothetical protein
MIWKHRNEILHDSKGMERIPTRELNNSITQEWHNGDTNLFAPDQALIQGTTLPRLLQTSQEHKIAWLAQIRLAQTAYTTVQDGDVSTGASKASQTNE